MPMPKEPKRLNRAVIKEELVALTGDFIKAVILQQFIYWSERIKDFDQFIMEETARAEMYNREIRMDLTNGWIFKKAIELSEETMLGLKETAMRTHIGYLVDQGWLSRRRNPDEKWDKTFQYRVNLINIQLDLFKLGYVLEGYKHPFSSVDIMAIIEAENAIKSEARLTTSRTSENEVRDSENELRTSESEFRASDIEVRSSENGLRRFEKRGAIPETTPETTPETNYLINKTWEKFLNIIRTKVSDQVYTTFFQQTKVLLNNSKLFITCSNSFSQSWLKDRYRDLIKNTLLLIDPNITEFEILSLA